MRTLSVALFVVMLSGTLRAQATAARATQPAAVAAEASDAYAYRADGRRDPFVSLVGAGDAKGPVVKRTDGPGAFSVGEISVRGIMQSRNALVAMVQGPDNKTYLMHQGDKFADGTVKTVTVQGLVVLQDISDPLSMQRQREVRKLLRSLEDVNQ